MSITPIAVLVSGGGTNLQSLLDAFNGPESQHPVTLVISNRQDAYGLERAKKAGVPGVYIGKKNYPDEGARHQAMTDLLKEHGIQWIVLAGYLGILPEALVRTYENRILNIHPSLIPAFCGMGYHGLKVHEAALERGVRVSGATVHFVDAGTDTGPILLQETVPVLPEDTPETLQKRVLAVEHSILIQGVRAAVEGRIRWQGKQPWIVEPCSQES